MDKQPKLLVNVRDDSVNNHTLIEKDVHIEKSNKSKGNNKVETKNKTIIIENDISKN